ncbi:hypothetical protein GCM10011390_44420 [Aureimonas endophytica]|uniref:SnoaL-like domain-containing protein n=1 Tax=Aureimonas endophytica TaxID=2027858 RepID=A0A917EC70_9HYPH|nr:nuclear transport factor 2 family protein [Aureimonas endophytica]GGE20284.1 hypothetical protein GCM10011390_44420 [Aureimonas endophytica]
MSAFDPVDAVRRYHRAIADLDFSAIDGFFAEEAVYRSPGTGDIAGRPAILAAFRSYFERWHGQVAEDLLIEPVGAGGARSLWRLDAVEAATGRMRERRGEEIVRFGADGLIVSVDVRDTD